MKFEHKFEYQWGGKDTWYTKGKRWANKQKFPMDYLALSVIEWMWLWWTDAKTKAEMAKVDVQAEEIKEEWAKDDPKPIVTSKPSEVEGLDEISISAPFTATQDSLVE